MRDIQVNSWEEFFFLKIIYQLAELRKRIFFLTICIRRTKTALFSKSGRNNFSFYVEGKTVWNAPLLICYRYGIIPHHSGPVRSKANAIYNLVPRETPLQFGYWFYLEKVFFFLVILLLLIKFVYLVFSVKIYQNRFEQFMNFLRVQNTFLLAVDRWRTRTT